MPLDLIRISRTDPSLTKLMAIHYSQPKGFVGRNICYLVKYDNFIYGGIVGGSTPKYLPGRPYYWDTCLNNIVNNIFFHIEGPYPIHNFAQKVLKLWRERIKKDWVLEYSDCVIGYESLVELPRSGEVYKRDGWTEVGLTKGYTCKRIGGQGTDSWSGQRVWDRVNLRPKRVFQHAS